MRCLAISGIVILSATLLSAGPKKVISPTTTAANETIDVEATITLTEEEVTQKLGADPGQGIVILQVKVTPKTDKPVLFSPDDFILLAHDDGERSKPFEPGEIAGQGALVVQNGKTTVKKTSSTIGLGGMIGGGAGASAPKTDATTTKMETGKEGNTKLLEALKAKQFPSKESTEPVEGYLYFPLDGKHKLKNLAVLYRGPAGKLNLEFQH